MKDLKHRNTTFLLEENNSDQLIIFSHGFGVKWDSRGMFTDISSGIGKKYDYIYFNYYNEDSQGNTRIEKLDNQLERFQNILGFALEKYKNINIITHSFGVLCPLLSSLSKSQTIIILAPPTLIDKEVQLNKVQTRANSKFNPNGYSEVKRSDGSTTFINIEFYNSLKSYDIGELLNHSDIANKFIIQAIEDEVVSNEFNTPLNSSVNLIEIHGDHNFKDSTRAELLKQIKNTL
jgi:hypothetical protein